MTWTTSAWTWAPLFRHPGRDPRVRVHGRCAPGHRLEVADGGAEEGDHAGSAGRDRARVALEVAQERLDPQPRVLADVAGAGHRRMMTRAVSSVTPPGGSRSASTASARVSGPAAPWRARDPASRPRPASMSSRPRPT